MPGKRRPPNPPEPTAAGVVGLGLDAADGHTRVTRTAEMVLLGGSNETHERMQETAIRFAEALEKRGKRLADTTVREAADLLRAARDRTG